MHLRGCVDIFKNNQTYKHTNTPHSIQARQQSQLQKCMYVCMYACMHAYVLLKWLYLTAFTGWPVLLARYEASTIVLQRSAEPEVIQTKLRYQILALACHAEAAFMARQLSDLDARLETREPSAATLFVLAHETTSRTPRCTPTVSKITC